MFKSFCWTLFNTMVIWEKDKMRTMNKSSKMIYVLINIIEKMVKSRGKLWTSCINKKKKKTKKENEESNQIPGGLIAQYMNL